MYKSTNERLFYKRFVSWKFLLVNIVQSSLQTQTHPNRETPSHTHTYTHTHLHAHTHTHTHIHTHKQVLSHARLVAETAYKHERKQNQSRLNCGLSSLCKYWTDSTFYQYLPLSLLQLLAESLIFTTCYLLENHITAFRHLLLSSLYTNSTAYKIWNVKTLELLKKQLKSRNRLLRQVIIGILLRLKSAEIVSDIDLQNRFECSIFFNIKNFSCQI